MASRTETFTTQIFLNDQQAKNKLAGLEVELKRLRTEQEKAAKAGDWDKFKQVKKDIKQTTKEMNAMKTSAQKVAHTLDNLKTSSIKDIRRTMNAINLELRSGAVERGSKQWQFLNEQLKKCKQELSDIYSESKQTSSSGILSKSWNFLNKNWGALTQLWGTVTGLSNTVRQCTKAFAEMDQEMVNVQKYTGQTKKEVVEMNEDFKKMNTRTSREQLNQLAGSAGRLGIQGKKDIEEFVDAADKINVALGDDLGDKAVDQIGKLAMMFGEDKALGLRGAMLATGSAVNELAQSSSASAGYLVDFTARLSGVGKQAGLTQQQIMGFASVLDPNMQQDETAATAMQNLITKMFQNPAKFAALAGKSVKEFTDLLKTDANEALLQFFGAMKKNGGFAQLAPMFDEMKMDGSRAVGVLSVMADKLADVKTAQDIANKSYADGRSVINEFNTQMQSEQAALDMAKKNFKELAIQLGQQLMPIAKYAISTGSVAVRVLSTLITFTQKHIGTLISLAAYAGIVAAVYNAAAIKAKALAAWEVVMNGLHKTGAILAKTYAVTITGLKAVFFLLTGQIKKAQATMLALRATVVANPYAAVTAALLGLAAAVYYVIKAIRSHSKAVHDNLLSVRSQRACIKDLNEATTEMGKSTAEERTRIERLTNIINSNVYSYNEKKQAMIALEKIVPGYHRNLRNEASLTASNNKALKEYVDRLNDAAMAQALYNRMVELQGQAFDLDQEIKRHKNSAKAVQAEINRHPGKYNEREHAVMGGMTVMSADVYSEEAYDKRKELQQWVELSQKASDNLTIVRNRMKNISDYLEKNRGVRSYYDKLVSNGTGTAATPPEWNPNTGNPGHYTDPKEIARQQKKAERDRKSAETKAKQREAQMKKEEREHYQNEIKEAKGHTDQLQAQNILAYSQGQKTYTEYLDAQHEIAVNGYKELEKIYKKYGTDYGQWQDEIAKEQTKKEEDHSKGLLSDIALKEQQEIAAAKNNYYDDNSAIYMNEEALNERIFEIEMSAQADRIAALAEGSQEWLDAKAELIQKEEEHELSLRQHYQELLSQYREQWGRQDIAELERIALMGLDMLHKKGLVKEEEYQQMLQNIRLYYASQQSQQNLENSAGEQFKKRSHEAYTTASNNANADYQNAHPTGTGITDYFTQDVSVFSSTLANIRTMEQQGVISHQEAMAAMSEATATMCEGIASKMQAAYDAVSPIMDAMSSYYSAQCDLEVAQTEKKYEKLIDGAGNNQAKQKKLEEKKEKEIAKIKTKYNRKQMKMQIAQALAQTAMSAINAYASVWAGAPWPAAQVLAPIAAGLAVAAGMMQIATIKKQQQAQEAGYYSGGFTGGTSYRREAGVVHEGEFVANHHAVGNSELLPAFRLIDLAQRNNTVGSLTAADVSRSMGVGGTTVVSAPQVNVVSDNSDMTATLQQARDTIERLGALIEDGIHADVVIDGPNGLDRQYRRFQRLKGNV